jgi:hypothetical protein
MPKTLQFAGEGRGRGSWRAVLGHSMGGYRFRYGPMCKCLCAPRNDKPGKVVDLTGRQLPQIPLARNFIFLDIFCKRWWHKFCILWSSVSPMRPKAMDCARPAPSFISSFWASRNIKLGFTNSLLNSVHCFNRLNCRYLLYCKKG